MNSHGVADDRHEMSNAMHPIYEAMLLPAIKPKTDSDSPSGPFSAMTHPAAASYTVVRSSPYSGYSNLETDDGSDEADVPLVDGNFGRLSIDRP